MGVVIPVRRLPHSGRVQPHRAVLVPRSSYATDVIGAEEAEEAEEAKAREAKRIEREEARKAQQEAREAYEGLTKTELSDQLAGRGLPKTGNVGDLIERLVSADSE